MWTQQPRCDRSWGRLMISSIIRLPSPGQTPLVGEDSSERLWVCLCCACLYVHLKMRKCRHTLHRYKTIHPTSIPFIMLYLYSVNTGRVAHGAVWTCDRGAAVSHCRNKPVFLLSKKKAGGIYLVWQRIKITVVINKSLLNHNIISISIHFTLQASPDTRQVFLPS